MTLAPLSRLIDHACWSLEPYAAWLAEAGDGAPAKSGALLAHAVAVLEQWLDRLHGRDGGGDVWPTWAPAAARARLTEVRAGFAAWLAAAATPTVAIEDALIEAATHTTGHLGQLDAAYRATGAPRLDLGFLAYRRVGAAS